MNKNMNQYQICIKTVMDTSDDEITFDENGISNHWWEYQKRAESELIQGEKGIKFAESLAKKISKENKTKDYDCLIGISGGVDSSYTAYWVKRLGLRPLAVHMDNGWNSELAVANIENLIKKLKIDLYTEVLNWPEFRDIQRCFFLASVPNCEMPTDHAIVATLFRLASKLKIKYIISGSNLATEGVIQNNIGHDNKDFVHIKDLHRRFGTIPIRTFPSLSPARFAKSILLDRVKFIPILNYVGYHRSNAIKLLENELGWRNYGRKHGESTFTRFFQEYYLPTKFGVDKRRMHLSSLICAGQITRDEALKALEKPLYTPEELEREIDFVAKKLQFSRDEFENILSAKPKLHTDYRTSILFRQKKNPIYQWARKIATGRNKLY